MTISNSRFLALISYLKCLTVMGNEIWEGMGKLKVLKLSKLRLDFPHLVHCNLDLSWP